MKHITITRSCVDLMENKNSPEPELLDLTAAKLDYFREEGGCEQVAMKVWVLFILVRGAYTR